MHCIICNRGDDIVMLMEMPVEVNYLGYTAHIIGNANPNEYICLPCIGFQFDDLLRSEAKNVSSLF